RGHQPQPCQCPGRGTPDDHPPAERRRARPIRAAPRDSTRHGWLIPDYVTLTTVFCWIVWPSRTIRDRGMEKVMAASRLQPDTNPRPFDGKRMIYGGFEMIVTA